MKKRKFSGLVFIDLWKILNGLMKLRNYQILLSIYLITMIKNHLNVWLKGIKRRKKIKVYLNHHLEGGQVMDKNNDYKEMNNRIIMVTCVKR